MLRPADDIYRLMYGEGAPQRVAGAPPVMPMAPPHLKGLPGEICPHCGGGGGGGGGVSSPGFEFPPYTPPPSEHLAGQWGFPERVSGEEAEIGHSSGLVAAGPGAVRRVAGVPEQMEPDAEPVLGTSVLRCGPSLALPSASECGGRFARPESAGLLAHQAMHANIAPWLSPWDLPNAYPIEKPVGWDAILAEIRRASDWERTIRIWWILWAGIQRRVLQSWVYWQTSPIYPRTFDRTESLRAAKLALKLLLLQDTTAMGALGVLAGMALRVGEPGKPSPEAESELLDLANAVVACTLSWYGMGLELWERVKAESPQFANIAAEALESIPRYNPNVPYVPEPRG